jgi:hypothetical protein
MLQGGSFQLPVRRAGPYSYTMGIAWIDREALTDAATVEQDWASARLSLTLLLSGPLFVTGLSAVIPWFHAAMIIAFGMAPYMGLWVGLSDVLDRDGRRARGELRSAMGTIVPAVPGEPEITANRTTIHRREGSPNLPPPGDYLLTWISARGRGALLVSAESPGSAPARTRTRVQPAGPDRLTFVLILFFCLNIVYTVVSAVPMSIVALDNEQPASSFIFMVTIFIAIMALWVFPARMLITDWLRTRRTARTAARLLSSPGAEVRAAPQEA